MGKIKRVISIIHSLSVMSTEQIEEAKIIIEQEETFSESQKIGLLELEGWARDGLTDEQIAYNMGINKATLYRWKEKYCDICDSLKRGKEVVDRQVENSLFERALGGTHEVRKTFKVKEKYYDDHGKLCEKEKLVRATDEVYIPGDTTAQIFWLKNRKPQKWRDKWEIEDHSAVDKLDMILAEMKAAAEAEQGNNGE